jgi:hypothetical protein
MSGEGWSIPIPYRSRDDSLRDVAILANRLPADEARVVQHIVLEAHAAGDDNAGHLLDRLGDLEPEQRRQVLDNAREACGLPRSEDIDRRERFTRLQQAQPVSRDRQGRSYQTCHAEGCASYPTGPSGEWVLHPARRWFCDAHTDQAEPGDLDPMQPIAVCDWRDFSEVPDPAEQAKLIAEQQRLREEDDRRNQRREAEAVAIREAQERYAAEHPSPWPPGFFG